MKCETIQPNLLDYSKGLLSGPDSDAVRAHVAGCAECAALLENEAAFALRLQSLPEESPANDVWALIRARTKPRRLRPLAWVRAVTATRIRRLAAIGAAAVVLAGALTLTPPERSEPVVRPPAAQVVSWSDDPLKDHTDAMVQYIDRM